MPDRVILCAAEKLARHPCLSSEQNIVELGCGWELPASYIQKSFGSRILVTDANANHQLKRYQQLISRFNGVVAPFFQRSFCQRVLDDLSNIDLLVGVHPFPI